MRIRGRGRLEGGVEGRIKSPSGRVFGLTVQCSHCRELHNILSFKRSPHERVDPVKASGLQHKRVSVKIASVNIVVMLLSNFRSCSWLSRFVS